MPTVLITGANRGIGLEFVRQYLADKWDVIACCRAPADAKELKALAERHASLHIEGLEVDDEKSIGALAAKVQGMAIDVLINNAGIYTGGTEKVSAGMGDKTQEFGTIDSAAWMKVLRVNVIAPIKVIEALAPGLKAGVKIINISSRMGSLADMGAGSLAYRSSKTGLNGAMRVIAHDLRERGMIIANFHPGWVQTDMGGKNAHLTPAQSVTQMRQTIATLTPEHSGRFLSYDGQVIPW